MCCDCIQEGDRCFPPLLILNACERDCADLAMIFIRAVSLASGATTAVGAVWVFLSYIIEGQTCVSVCVCAYGCELPQKQGSTDNLSSIDIHSSVSGSVSGCQL